MDIFDELNKKHKISKTWIASHAGLTYHAFLYALKRGLRPDEVEKIEQSLRSLGRELRAFKVPKELKAKKTTVR